MSSPLPGARSSAIPDPIPMPADRKTVSRIRFLFTISLLEDGVTGAKRLPSKGPNQTNESCNSAALSPVTVPSGQLVINRAITLIDPRGAARVSMSVNGLISPVNWHDGPRIIRTILHRRRETHPSHQNQCFRNSATIIYCARATTLPASRPSLCLARTRCWDSSGRVLEGAAAPCPKVGCPWKAGFGPSLVNMTLAPSRRII
jgi:hypothetical protein